MPLPNDPTVHDLWINGQPQGSISLYDRALQYGDGFFTTLLVMEGKLLNWSAHLQRIRRSTKALAMPEVNESLLLEWLSRALQHYFDKQANRHAIVKILWTRGAGGVGYQAPQPADMQCLIYLKASPYASPESMCSLPPICLGLSSFHASITDFAGIKTLNRLENVMARTQILEQGWDEGVMLDALGRVTCATQSNLFMIQNQRIVTPKLDQAGVAGTTRAGLFELLSQKGWQVVEQTLTLQDLHSADELFCCNAVRGVQPVQYWMGEKKSTKLSREIQSSWVQWLTDHATAVPMSEEIK